MVVGKHRIMERSQEANIIIQEDMIVTLDNMVAVGMVQGHQILNIYLQQSILFDDRLNMKESYLKDDYKIYSQKICKDVFVIIS